ncbi:MAG: hypothetical protein H0U60_01035 [Blastocatellia bacterium]|nr:hypothetical protein [Blastocatellia bacterium]
MKKVIIGLVLLIAITLVTVLWLRTGKSSQGASVAATSNSSSGEKQQSTAAPNHAAMAMVPAYYKAAPNPNTLLPTLSPELFTGNKRLAYLAAKEIPQTLAQLPCYCHCDKGLGHKSLHSCFESEHGANCGICMGEALMASQLEKRAKLSAAEIREQIIAAYGTPENE